MLRKVYLKEYQENTYNDTKEDNMGHFIGEVVTKWVKDNKKDRQMILQQDFSFVDKKGKTWTAPKGLVFDGASIPKFFWRVIGSPFVGNFRRGAVIHDSYYSNLEEPKKDVDNMFYEAMLVDGVSKWRAKAMYQAVKWFAPKW